MSALVITQIDAESELFINFMQQWGEEIEQIFPHFSDEDSKYGEVLILKYEGNIVGIFIFQFKGDQIQVDVDYVIPEARDIGIGQQFFKQKISEFREMGFVNIVALTSDDAHRSYLINCGFKPQTKHPDWFELSLL